MVIPDQAIGLLEHSPNVVFFTGAGISAESGIPTYLDKLPEPWAQCDPRELETAKAFKASPALIWGWYLWRRAVVAKAVPNAAHLAIARLGSATRKVTVITQNVDDLHERAGSPNVIHLHGNLAIPKCYACHRPAELPKGEAEKEVGILTEPPRCQRCNGRMRPAVVWYGEDLPSAAWREALRLVKECDVLVSVGTSGQVMPAAGLLQAALDRGTGVIHVNITNVSKATPGELMIIGCAAEVLPALTGRNT
ncbi:NAD-dependent protein deacylase [Pseudomonas syringae]|nr:NAD-dependent protein deacylase [Pseudomonas syringae]